MRWRAGGRAGIGVALAAAAALAHLACSPKLPPAPESPTAAVVGSRTITVDEVDAQIKDALFERSFPPGDTARLFDARQAALDGIVDEEVIAQAAAGSGLDPDAWLEREAAVRYPVQDADVDAFWERYQERLPKDRPEEEMRAEIRAYLAGENAKELVAELRREAKVRIALARPRHDVEPRGPARGPDDALVTIVEFSDFECPFCLRVVPTVQELLARYPDDVRLYYRHLPLPSHGRARPAAVAAVCAEQQGEFWAYHDLLFANTRALGDEALAGYAEQLGLDLDLYRACLSSPEATARVEEDLAAAAALGVTGTPTFFVNGVRLKGAQPLSTFVRLIDEELEAGRAAE